MSSARLVDSIGMFATPVDIIREKEGSYNSKGRYVPGATTETCFANISIQPLSARERLQLPEAIRTKELVLVYSKDELRTDRPGDGLKADRFVYKGNTYVVNTVEDWSDHGGFYKVIAEKAND